MTYQDEGWPDAGRIGALGLLHRYRMTILAGMALGLAGGLALYRITPPSFVAEAALSLNDSQVQVLPTDALIAPRSRDGLNLRTELDVIGSRGMAERVAARLGAADQETAPSGALATLLRLVPAAWLPPGTRAWLAGPPQPEADAAVDRLLRGLKVSNDGRSGTIYITFTAHSPGTAARVANLYADEYVAEGAERHSAAARDAAGWLGGKLTDLRHAVETSEAAAQAYRRSIGLQDPGGLSLQSQILSAMSAQMVAARAARLGAEARLQTATALRRAGGPIESFQDVLSSPVIQSLRKDESQIARSIHELEQGGAGGSVQLPMLRLQLSSVRQQVDAEVSRILAGLQEEVAIARRKEDQLDQAFADAQRQSADTNDAAVHLNQLEREAAANRTVYESFLTRYKQSIEQENIPAPDARLLSRAPVPSAPASPRLVPLVLLGLLGGGLSGLGLSLLRHRLDDTVRSAGDFEAIARVPVLGLVPARRARHRPVLRKLVDSSAYGPLRRLDTTLRLYPLTRHAQVLALGSVGPGSRATSLVLDLARAMALGGRSVILVEAGADRRRRPHGQRAPGEPDPASLPQQEIEAAVRVDRQSGARVLTLGDIAAFRPPSFHAGVWTALIGYLRASYDVVLVHTPVSPDSPTSGMVLSEADGTILVGRLDRTGRRETADTVHQLALCGIDLVGLIATGAGEQAGARRPDWLVRLGEPGMHRNVTGRRAARPAERKAIEAVDTLQRRALP